MNKPRMPKRVRELNKEEWIEEALSELEYESMPEDVQEFLTHYGVEVTLDEIKVVARSLNVDENFFEELS